MKVSRVKNHRIYEEVCPNVMPAFLSFVGETGIALFSLNEIGKSLIKLNIDVSFRDEVRYLLYRDYRGVDFFEEISKRWNGKPRATFDL